MSNPYGITITIEVVKGGYILTGPSADMGSIDDDYEVSRQVFQSIDDVVSSLKVSLENLKNTA